MRVHDVVVLVQEDVGVFSLGARRGLRARAQASRRRADEVGPEAALYGDRLHDFLAVLALEDPPAAVREAEERAWTGRDVTDDWGGSGG